MTNYNNGNWWGWNGGECPVHHKTEIDIVFSDGRRVKGPAGSMRWSHIGSCGDIIAFRVVKEHREPREFWLDTQEGTWTTFRPPHRAEKYLIHVREVLE